MGRRLRMVGAITAGTLCGAVISTGVAYLWLCFGSAPHTDGIISI